MSITVNIVFTPSTSSVVTGISITCSSTMSTPPPTTSSAKPTNRKHTSYEDLAKKKIAKQGDMDPIPYWQGMLRHLIEQWKWRAKKNKERNSCNGKGTCSTVCR
ncbi:hypothetical protein L1987_52438 [Smallanthus sonchifolius]|uniref:Uncharacterized protein n=1 Tax=Smallanthus sonchifolius TaxID=185202 RepID=A0ACB9ET65_9ASTR|nr:hypothetical protein L1987_52438 [Smallanthus sonchifolius]